MKKTIKDTGIPSRNFDKEIIHFFIKVEIMFLTCYNLSHERKK